MPPEPRQTVINMALFAAAFAVVMAIIFTQPASRMARTSPVAQSAALSTAVTQPPESRPAP
jgi:hypothetical protein